MAEDAMLAYKQFYKEGGWWHALFSQARCRSIGMLSRQMYSPFNQEKRYYSTMCQKFQES